MQSMLPGELIYLNLLIIRQQARQDTANSSSDAHIQAATNMAYPGVELTWKAGHDDQWLSYYEVLRDGTLLGRVAKGTYYFDHSAGADLAAKLRSAHVDGAGLRSGLIAAEASGGKRALVLDDTAADIQFVGAWRKQSGLQPAYLGTISGSNQRAQASSLSSRERSSPGLPSWATMAARPEFQSTVNSTPWWTRIPPTISGSWNLQQDLSFRGQAQSENFRPEPAARCLWHRNGGLY